MPDTEKNQPPLVTVITVTYNSSAYVRDAIESVLAQDYPNIEYIIGDDCSTDNTWAIIQEYKDKRIRAYRNETNLREYPNRNKAIGLATGKYLMFIDGDDIIFSHGIRFFVEQMEAFPEAGFAVQKNYYNNILFPALLNSEEAIVNYFFGKEAMLSSSFASNFFRADLIGKYKLSEKYRTGDEEIRLRLALLHPVLLVAGWVSWPRETPGQASAKLLPGTGLIELKHLMEDFQKEGFLNSLTSSLTDVVMSTLDRRILNLAVRCLFKGNISAYLRLMSAAQLTLRDFFRKKDIKVPSDIFDNYSPINPLKKGYLGGFTKA